MPHLTGAKNNVTKGFGLVETPQPVNRERLLLPVKHRRRAYLACCTLHVLLAQGLSDIVGGYIQGIHAIRAQPDAHAVVARAKQLDLPDTRQTRQRLAHLRAGIVADKQRGMGTLR
ncbi:hypothetical protein D3C85_1233720 [compost metagenome]